MANIHLSHNNVLVRWAYFLSGGAPNQTSQVALYWRAFVLTPLFWLALIGGSYGFVHGMWKAPKATIAVVVLVLVGLTLLGLVLTITAENEKGDSVKLFEDVYFD